jgi:Mrp family chromosome partitioning ATPase
MVTSGLEREGKSTTLANLAVAMARSGRSVILVDLDLRRPLVDAIFDVARQPGVTDVAVGSVTLADALVDVPVGRAPTNGGGSTAVLGADQPGWTTRPAAPEGSLRVLTSGPLPPDPGEFVGTERMAEILRDLRRLADVVLVDAPPLFHVGDGLVLSAQVDAALLVTRIGVIRRPMVDELRRLVLTMPAAKLGVVVTGAQAASDYRYSGGYYQSPPPARKHSAVESAR